MLAYLGLGSDRGNRAAWLTRARNEMAAAGLRVSRASSLWLTEPVGAPGLPWFVNCVVEVTDPPPAADLLARALAIETRCGRRRTGCGIEPRTLDIDLLLYDRQVIHDPDLEVPHPRMHDRRFVLEPLAEIAPGVTDPSREQTVAELLAAAPRSPGVWLLAPFPG